MATAREEMDALLTEAIRVAIHFLEKRGRFFPFAVGMDGDGRIQHFMAFAGDEQSETDPQIEQTIQAVRVSADRGEIRGAAIVSDVFIRSAPGVDPSDAIRIQIEHLGGSPVTCYLPYQWQLEPETATVQPGTLFAEVGIAVLFGCGDSGSGSV